MSITILAGDNRQTLRTLPDASVQTCVTSPPYFGLRDYGHEGQIGLEQTPDAYVAELIAVFREVKRVLKDDGTLWLNLGDSYARTGGTDKAPPSGIVGSTRRTLEQISDRKQTAPDGLKPKDLIGIPWRVAFALQADGWYLRQDIIWHKPNPMPESVTDRCTKAHEYIFLLSKSARYYYDAKAIEEPSAEVSIARRGRADLRQKEGWAEAYHGNPPVGLAGGRGGKNAFRGQGHFREGEKGPANREGREMKEVGVGATRNRRSVWTVSTKPYKGAHFATFPTDLIRPCILAGAPVGGAVLDPFGGSGTTGKVALENGRSAILCELNPAYVELIKERTKDAQQLV